MCCADLDTGVIKVVLDDCVHIACNFREELSRGLPFPDATVGGSEDGGKVSDSRLPRGGL